MTSGVKFALEDGNKTKIAICTKARDKLSVEFKRRFPNVAPSTACDN
jgi:hypothetical protein